MAGGIVKRWNGKDSRKNVRHRGFLERIEGEIGFLVQREFADSAFNRLIVELVVDRTISLVIKRLARSRNVPQNQPVAVFFNHLCEQGIAIDDFLDLFFEFRAQTLDLLVNVGGNALFWL